MNELLAECFGAQLWLLTREGRDALLERFAWNYVVLGCAIGIFSLDENRRMVPQWDALYSAARLVRLSDGTVVVR